MVNIVDVVVLVLFCFVDIVYEFHGCFYHGCPRCYPSRKTRNPVNQKTMEVLYDETQAKLELLRGQGYVVVICWEHDFDELIRECQVDLSQLQFPQRIPLDVRQAMYGGTLRCY